MIYFISDTHFSHENIIKYCDRPFKNIEDMDNKIIQSWNDTVKKEDTIYHLGDFSIGKTEILKSIFNRLNGNIVLVRGNHDGKSASYYEKIGFKVLKNAPIILEEYKLILSHVPLPDSKIPDGYINVHGHIHNMKLNDGYDKKYYSEEKHINVSADVLGFIPTSLEKVNKRRQECYLKKVV